MKTFKTPLWLNVTLLVINYKNITKETWKDFYFNIMNFYVYGSSI